METYKLNINEICELVKKCLSLLNENDSSMNEIEMIKQEAIANGTFMKAPNGAKTKLKTETQWLQVRTSNFMKWFGDWLNDPQSSSKILDENGEPLIVYHGSTKRFDTFNKSKIGSTTGDKSGFYFSNNRKISKDYYSRETGSVWGNVQLLFGIHKNYKPTVYDTFIRAFNPFVYDFGGKRDVGGIRQKIIANAQKEGYDCVILKNIQDGPPVVQDAYVVFEPNQIKSATSNMGNFDIEQNSINAE